MELRLQVSGAPSSSHTHAPPTDPPAGRLCLCAPCLAASGQDRDGLSHCGYTQAQSGLARSLEQPLRDLLAGGQPGFDAAAAASSPVGQALANLVLAGQKLSPPLLPQLLPLLRYKHHLPAQDLER